jgi:hypothetical protein
MKLKNLARQSLLPADQFFSRIFSTKFLGIVPIQYTTRIYTISISCDRPFKSPAMSDNVESKIDF